MGKPKQDVLQGTLDLLILQTLGSLGPLHGYGIASHIQRISKDALRVEEGSLYPALHRVEQLGWIRAAWRLSENGRRARYYALTAAGHKQLAVERDSWEKLTSGVARVLDFAESGG